MEGAEEGDLTQCRAAAEGAYYSAEGTLMRGPQSKYLVVAIAVGLVVLR